MERTETTGGFGQRGGLLLPIPQRAHEGSGVLVSWPLVRAAEGPEAILSVGRVSTEAAGETGNHTGHLVGAGSRLSCSLDGSGGKRMFPAYHECRAGLCTEPSGMGNKGMPHGVSTGQ